MRGILSHDRHLLTPQEDLIGEVGDDLSISRGANTFEDYFPEHRLVSLKLAART